MNELLQEGRYRIIRQIGQNDTGSIYEGLDNIFDRKIFINQCAYNGRKNMSDEEKVLKGIKHENFLRVIDYFPETNGWFAIMEAEEGEFLSDVLAEQKPPASFSDVMNWTEQLLDALGYLHLHLPPIVYGDIKPQNVILTPGGSVKLITSAILKTRNTNKNFSKPSTLALNYSPLEQIWDGLDSASQKVIASSYDEAAEKILRQSVDARSDIYSLGVLVYQMLAKQLPKNALERSIEILEGNPDPLTSPAALSPNVPSEISEILLKALEIRRENRFDSSVIMRQVLRTAFVRVKERESLEQETEKNAPAPVAEPETAPVSRIEPEKSFALPAESFALPAEQEAAPVSLTEDPFELDELFELEDLPAIEPAGAFMPPQNAAQGAHQIPDQKSEEPEIEELEEPKIEKTAEEHSGISRPDSLSLPVGQKQNSAADQVKQPAETRSEPPMTETAADMEAEETTGERAGLFDLSPEVSTTEAATEEIASTEETASTEEVISANEAEKIVPENPRTDYKKDYSSDEFSILFDNGEAKKRSAWLVPAAIILVILIGGGAFGAWMFVSGSGSNAAGSSSVPDQSVENPVIDSQTAADAQIPPPSSDTEVPAAANVENADSQAYSSAANTGAEISAETELQSNPVETQETAPTAKKQTIVRSKPSASKPQTAAARPPEKQPKKVTVDDLISDY